MKTFQLEGKSREVAATSADQKRALKAMRKNNEIPAVLYGGEKVSHFTITKDSVRNLVYSPEIFVVELTIDGKKTACNRRYPAHGLLGSVRKQTGSNGSSGCSGRSRRRC